MILPAAGKLLIAEPFLKDPNFVRSVLLLCEHNQDGCVGFVLNRLYEYRLDELNVDFKGFPIPIYYGGPVEMTSIHFIHQYPDLIPDAIKICDDIYWGGNFETLTTLIKNRSIDLNKLKIFIGYSGWDKNQLEDEIKENTWLLTNANTKLVFDTNTATIWKNGIKLLGSKYEMMINFPVDPQLN